ncbi:hypothetical protein IJJ27_02865 [bacterium]|nr:hypothetical protein [bacterium]
MKIIPAILESEIEKVAQKLDLVRLDGSADTVQIDIIDGQLSPQLTVTPYDLKNLDWTGIKADFHLMTEDPLDYVWELAAQGEQLPVRAVFGQVERMSDQKAFLQAVKDQGWLAGLALDLETPLESIDDASWKILDQLLLLAVPMGRQGQKFDERIWEKLHELEHLSAQYGVDVPVVVDGGVNPTVIPKLREHGVEAVAVGSYLWRGSFGERWNEAESET